MPTDEAARHHLLTVLEATLGTEAAMTLADHLPPSGWADVARRSDLDLLRVGFEADLHRELGGVRQAIIDLQRNLFFGVLGAIAANTALVVTITLAVAR